MRLHVDQARDIPVVQWLLHDGIFRADDLTLDQSSGEVLIRFAILEPTASRVVRVKYDQPSARKATLRLRHVRSLVVRDDAGIGEYDVGQVYWGATEHALVIQANAPLEAVFTMDQIDISFETIDD